MTLVSRTVGRLAVVLVASLLAASMSGCTGVIAVLTQHDDQQSEVDDVQAAIAQLPAVTDVTLSYVYDQDGLDQIGGSITLDASAQADAAGIAIAESSLLLEQISHASVSVSVITALTGGSVVLEATDASLDASTAEAMVAAMQDVDTHVAHADYTIGDGLRVNADLEPMPALEGLDVAIGVASTAFAHDVVEVTSVQWANASAPGSTLFVREELTDAVAAGVEALLLSPLAQDDALVAVHVRSEPGMQAATEGAVHAVMEPVGDETIDELTARIAPAAQAFVDASAESVRAAVWMQEYGVGDAAFSNE